MERVRNVELLGRLVARDTYRNDSESATVKNSTVVVSARKERLLMINHDMQLKFQSSPRATNYFINVALHR